MYISAHVFSYQLHQLNCRIVVDLEANATVHVRWEKKTRRAYLGDENPEVLQFTGIYVLYLIMSGGWLSNLILRNTCQPFILTLFYL